MFYTFQQICCDCKVINFTITDSMQFIADHGKGIFGLFHSGN